MSRVDVYVGLGSNLADPVAQVMAAKQALQSFPETELTRFSSLYSSPPMDASDQPDYINAVAEMRTQLLPKQLLTQLQSLETRQGRVREQRWGSRTLDLDILLYGDQQIHTNDLIVPHYDIARRAFVLMPLFEIAPDLDIPGHGLLSELVNACSGAGIEKLA
ncbi:MAG: 2-amino-4-hydroxy-6-hydroxymethyldihydropteridine diphosphokinase [Gammaproteobacteria bacterium]|nr:2-amino-4-hydroxy-6-hydroxymethyldihydropteridine diphosphokinase [Gammaproteobacteria bacterium]